MFTAYCDALRRTRNQDNVTPDELIPSKSPQIKITNITGGKQLPLPGSEHISQIPSIT